MALLFFVTTEEEAESFPPEKDGVGITQKQKSGVPWYIQDMLHNWLRPLLRGLQCVNSAPEN